MKTRFASGHESLCATLSVLLLLSAACSALAEPLRFSRHLSDNMVLQQGKPVVIRGFTAAQNEVSVSFGTQAATGVADQHGEWTVTLEPMAPDSRGAVLTAQTGDETSVLQNVVVGDVFMVARQTTIDITLGRDEQGQKAAKGLTPNPNLRVLTLKAVAAKDPQADLAESATAGWDILTTDSALRMGAASFFLLNKLGDSTDVPVGLVDLNMGGHFPIGWMSLDALYKTGEAFGEEKTSVETIAANMLKEAYAYESGAKQADIDDYYTKAAEQAAKRGKPVPPKPKLGPHPVNAPHFPAAGYNGSLYPIRGMALKGMMIQLGNDYPYTTYRDLFKAGSVPERGMLGQAYKDTYALRKWCIYTEPFTVPRIPAEWRAAFSDAALPVGLIMPPGSALKTIARHHCEMRELQRQIAMRDPNVGLILPESEHIPFSAQPADESVLADRCLQWIRGDVYGQNVPATGPLFDRIEANYAEARIHFKPGTAEGLRAASGSLDSFEVSGADGLFVPATAMVDGTTIRLTTDAINRIAHVRYNWKDKPDQGLTNASGLPAVPFRTDAHPYPRAIPQAEGDLPMEYRTAAKDWSDGDVVIVNGALKNDQSWSTGRCLGPTGVKADPFGPNLIVYYVLKGSPAEGKIERHDVIYEVNGKLLGEDPLRRVAEAIADAESHDGKGKLTFGLRRKGKDLTIPLTLEVLGSYSSTSPYDCPKSDRIVANMEAFLAERGGVMPRSHTVFQASDALFLLGAGTPSHQGLVRRFVYRRMSGWDLNKRLDPYEKKQPQSWRPAYEALLAGEYYLATGDRNVLPYLTYMCDLLAMLQIKLEPEPTPWPAALLGKEGGWRHNFYGGQGYNPMPCVGVPALLGFTFAKEAGASIDEAAYQRGIGLLRRGGVAVGNVGYGSWPTPITKVVPLDPEEMSAGTLTTHNGSISMGAVLFKILGEDKTSNVCGLKSVYAFNNTHEGHGGNFWNNCWTALGAKAYSKKGLQTFAQGNAWYRDLHRMYNHGHFQGNAKIGGGQLISLVAPRERLRITGAPESVFAANPPESLRPALMAHWNRDYAEAEKRITALIASGELIGTDLIKAQQLQRATRELQESIAHDLDKVERLLNEGKLYEASLDLPQLSQIVAPGNARLAAIETTLSSPEQQTAIEQDQTRYDAALHAMDFDRLLPDASENKSEDWRSLTTVSQYSNFLRNSPSNVAEAEATRWRMKILEAIDQAPAGWNKLNFDDSRWTPTTLPISWHLNHTVLLRAPFQVEDKQKVRALWVRKYTFRQQNMMIHINGHLVAKINNANAESILDIPLNEGALRSLKNGKNIISATFRNNWRWGRYTRQVEVDTDNSVYNNGISLALEMSE